MSAAAGQGSPRNAIPTYACTGGGAVPLGYEQIGGLNAAKGLTVPPGAVLAVIVPEAQAVRWRDDAVDPTAVVGMPLAVGQALAYTSNLAAIKFFEQAASAKLNVSYY